jgi:hypothetical protein
MGGVRTSALDIPAVMDRALAWVVENLAEFHPFKDGRRWDVQRAQRVSELAIALVCLKEVAAYEDPRLTQILDTLCAIQSHQRFRDRVLRMPAEFVLYCDLYALLARMGRADTWQREVLSRAVAHGLLHQSERLPHRVMDVSLSLELAGLEVDWPTLEEAYQESILARRLDPHYLRESDLYAITHVIMFQYGFGLRDRRQIYDENERRRLDRLLTVLLVDVCLQKHWDLVSELLICWDCIELRHSYVYESAWAALASVQADSGALPGPERAIAHRRQSFDSPEAEAEMRSSFKHCYHTTLTTLVAGALRLRRARRSMGDSSQMDVPESGQAGCTAAELRRRRECLEQAREFFVEDLESIAADCCWQPERAAQDLVGVWIYESITGSAGQFERALDRLARSRQKGVRQRNALNWSASPDCTVLVLAGLMASASGVSIPEYEKFTSAVIRGLSDGALSGPGTLTIHRVLSRLGLIEGPPPVTDAQMSVYLARFNIAGPKSELMELVSMAEAYSSNAAQSPKLRSVLQDVLEGMQAHMLREYHLISGMRALRALNCLSPATSRSTMLAYRFLCCQQQANGSLGFLGPELDVLTRQPDSTPQGWTAEAKGSLVVAQVTAHGAWTLAESLEGSWRLGTAFFEWCLQPAD